MFQMYVIKYLSLNSAVNAVYVKDRKKNPVCQENIFLKAMLAEVYYRFSSSQYFYPKKGSNVRLRTLFKLPRKKDISNL